jgi:hypothetical protein
MKVDRLSCSVFLIFLSCSSCVPAGTATDDSETAASTPAAIPTDEPPVSELISVDDVWNRYVNHALGVSLLVPKASYRLDAGCEWIGGAGEGSYRPVAASVPVVVLEEGDRVIVTPQSYSELTKQTQVPSGLGYRSNFAGCEPREVTPDLVLEPGNATYAWDIRVSAISSLGDLETLVDEVFGACFSLGDMTPLVDREMLRVRVRGDEKPVEESQCLLNETYVFYYSPRHDRAAAWRTGQSIHFLSSPAYDGYDQEMLDSFRFIP